MSVLTAPHIDYPGISPLIALTAGTCVTLLAGLLPRGTGRAMSVTAALLTLATALGLTVWQLGDSKSLVEGFTFLSKVVTAANLPLYLCCSLALAILWRRGETQAARGLLGIAVLGVAYSVFAFIGLGHEPFVLGVVLAVAGLPLYVFMRWRRAAVANAAR